VEQWNYGIAIMLSNIQVFIYIILVDSSHTVGTLRSHNSKYFNLNIFATYLIDKYENNYLIYEFINMIYLYFIFKRIIKNII